MLLTNDNSCFYCNIVNKAAGRSGGKANTIDVNEMKMTLLMTIMIIIMQRKVLVVVEIM